MNLFNMAHDLAAEAERDLGELTGEQKLQLAQIYATLSVSQEISKIWDEGLKVRADELSVTTRGESRRRTGLL